MKTIEWTRSWPASLLVGQIPEVDDVRPKVCPRCKEPARRGTRVILHGHGCRIRMVVVAPALGDDAPTEVLECWQRRYRCTACKAILVVLPAGVMPRYLYSAAAIVKELVLRAQKRYRPPGAKRTRRFHFKTLQRWYYTAKADLAGGLLPKSRARGFARKLDDEQRDLLLQMRKENRSAAAELVLSEAVRNGIVAEGQLSEPTLRRLYRSAGLPRVSQRRASRKGDVQRRRWQAKHPGDLWHGDVCHLAQLDEQGCARRVLVHGFLDDASRYCPALMPRYQERERDMLEVFCGALLRHPAPKTLYLDNGACYSGEVLPLVCKRFGIRLVHAQPYCPEARGKMERLWCTMRRPCTDHLPPTADAHQVGQALWAWMDTDYHRRPHAALMGQTPRSATCTC